MHTKKEKPFVCVDANKGLFRAEESKKKGPILVLSIYWYTFFRLL
jgi:hypothetical protein